MTASRSGDAILSRMVILFDIDGTLIDHDGAEAVAVEALRARMQCEEDGEGFLHRWRIAFDRYYRRYLVGELSLEQQRRERFREVLDPNLSDEAADRLIASYIDQYLAACRLYEDVESTLAQLSGYPMGIVSNGDRSQQEYKLAKTGIGRYFGPLILSAECGMAKPARGIFELACGSMGVCPAEAVYVGDRLDVDAEGACSAGMHGIWLDRSGSAGDCGPSKRIGSLSELPAVVRLIESVSN